MNTPAASPAPIIEPAKFLAMGPNTRTSHMITMNGREFIVCQYSKGEYLNSDTLQAKADSGLWYCYARATFCALKIEGEGATPLAAFEDMQSRAKAETDRAILIYCLPRA